MEAQSDLVSRVVPPLGHSSLVSRLSPFVPRLGFPVASHALMQKTWPKRRRGAATQASGDNLLRPLTALELGYHHTARKKKKNVFLCITYVHTEYTRQTATFFVCQLLLQSDNCEIMSFLLVVLSRIYRYLSCYFFEARHPSRPTAYPHMGVRI